VDLREKDIQMAQADVVSSRASLEQARTNLRYTRIVAPRDGIVLQKPVEEGTVIASSRSSTGSGPTIVVLGDTSRVFIVTQVDETDIAAVEVGQEADITVDAYANERFEGKVTRIDPLATVEQNVTTIPVTVEIERPDARLKPGMNANVEFITARHENVLVVPNEAVRDDDGGSTVRVLVDGKPVPRAVEVGVAGPETTEIRAGLLEGEEVVTRVIEPQSRRRQPSGQSPFSQQPIRRMR
jgi:HlyD family secretion protein